MSVTVNASISFSKAGLSDSFSAAQTAAMTVAGYNAQTPTIGTAVQAISTASITTLGYAFLRSLVTTTQTTCTITFGKMSGASLIGQTVLRPGEIAVMRLASGSYAAQAAGEGYKLLVANLEE